MAGGSQMLAETQEDEEIIKRVAALDIGKGRAGVLRTGAG